MSRSPQREIYDPLDRETNLDPYPAYRVLRRERPLYHNRERDFWALSRYEDVFAASRDWRRYSCSPDIELTPLDRLYGIREPTYVASDSDRHTVFREVLKPHFAPKPVAGLEGVVGDVAARLVAELVDRPAPDLAADLAQRFSVSVTCRVLGIPESDVAEVGRLFKRIWHRVPGATAVPEDASSAHGEARRYIAALAADGRADPSVLGTLLRAEAARTITPDEVVDIGVILLAAGIKTTSGLVSTAMLLLARHPDQQRQAVEDPTLFESVVEESLRLDSPSQWMPRVATTAIETPHGTIPPYARVLLLWGAANRDERRYDSPDRFDIMRPLKRHLSFGAGIHHCVGTPLARLEARRMLGAFFSRVRELELAGPPEYFFTPADRELSHLPVTFKAAG